MSNQNSEMDWDLPSESEGDEDDASNGDGFVPPANLVVRLKNEYLQAQEKAAKTPERTERSLFKQIDVGSSSNRPKRRTAKVAISYSADSPSSNTSFLKHSSESALQSILFTSSSQVCHTRVFKDVSLYLQSIKYERSRSASASSDVHDPRVNTCWVKRTVEEHNAHFCTHSLFPKSDHLASWNSKRESDKYLDSKRDRGEPPKHTPTSSLSSIDTMRIPGYDALSTNGHSNNIVEEYLSPNPNDLFVEDFQAFKALSDAEKQDVIQREAEEYGMEKPRGYNVSFHYNPHVEYHHFGSSHPMKPWRLTLTKQLIMAYGLEYTMDLYEPRPATFEELAIFHDREYTQFLSQ